MATVSVTGAPATDFPAELPPNPHCAPQWPEIAFPAAQTVTARELVQLRRNVLAVHQLVRLLRADDLMATDLSEGNDPASETQPFAPCAREGLMLALETCTESASLVMDRIECRADADAAP